MAAWMNRLLEGQDYQALIANLRQRFHTGLASLQRNGFEVRLLCATVRRPAAIGLSQGRLDELSFHFHPLYGIPWIPSSTFKGATRSFLTSYVSEDLQPELDRILGTQKAVSQLALTEAWPLPLESEQHYLEANVFNPHAAPFARSPEKYPPGDWYDPVPVFHLSLRRGVRFEMALIAGKSKVADTDLNTLQGWLSHTLQWAGVGARTRKAYGRFGLEKADLLSDAPGMS